MDWGVVNTAILLAVLGYVWKRDKIVDALRQALVGIESDGGGLIAEVKMLRERVATLERSLGVLNVSVSHLASSLDSLLRRPSERTRESDL